MLNKDLLAVYSALVICNHTPPPLTPTPGGWGGGGVGDGGGGGVLGNGCENEQGFDQSFATAVWGKWEIPGVCFI